MTTKQSIALKMYLKVRDVFEENLTKWADASEIKSSCEDFNSNTDKIIELENEFKKDISSFTVAKAAKREKLVNTAVPILNVLQVYAYDIKDDSLAKKINYSRNKLTKMKDLALVDKCKFAWKITKQLYGKSLTMGNESAKKDKKALANSVNIKGYGVNGQMIDNLEVANKEFIDATLALKDAISYKNKCAKKITDKVKSNDKILRNRLDKLLTLFELTDQNFYKSYTDARVLDSDTKANNEETKKAVVEPKQTGKEKSQAGKTTKATAQRRTRATTTATTNKSKTT